MLSFLSDKVLDFRSLSTSTVCHNAGIKKICIIIILFATRITSKNIKYVDNKSAGCDNKSAECQKSIKTLIKLATYCIKHNG